MPLRFVTLYACVLFWQGYVLPDIAEVATGGTTSTTIFLFCDVPVPQSLDGITDAFPVVVPTVTVTEFVPCPPVIVQSAGNDQV
jgi:hypothetical protein